MCLFIALLLNSLFDSHCLYTLFVDSYVQNEHMKFESQQGNNALIICGKDDREHGMICFVELSKAVALGLYCSLFL